jgi:hypothetical protein
MRLNALVIGILGGLALVAGALVVALGGSPGKLLILGVIVGVPALLFALLYRPADEARKDLKGRTDLDRLR